MKILDSIIELGTRRWALGFVRGGMEAVMEGDHLEVDWVKMPKDRWFADPFVLDVTEDEILLLVEDFGYDIRKGIISLLHINRVTMEITARKPLLELPTHLSFPAILRKDGHIYVYPESAKSGRLDMYEYDAEKEELTFVRTICDDVIWDSYITEAFGEPLLFTGAHTNNDYILDIYRWDSKKERFLHCDEVHSEFKNSRLGGALFEYRGEMYYPAQNCERVYGGAIDIKRIVESREPKVDRFRVETVKHLESPHPTMKLGMHTLNEYKGVVVIDVHGYKYGWKGAAIAWLVALKKKVKGFTSK
ncbi:MAG: hypothetical protein IKG86_07665 [Paludibacteraceae bacterium]|nr:hypothetical protein [Paludibacteraceae bacterium]